jgi:Flp pilus assembly protein CpaB
VKLSQRRLARPSLGGLIATRQGSLTLALLCAVCAAGILMFALGRYKTGLKPTIQQATVLVATGEIRKGTSGSTIASEQLYKSTPIVSTQLAAGAISNASALVGETVQADILPGQQLIASDFAAIVGVAGSLAPNQRAVSVSIDEAHGDTDVLQPGSRVDVYSTFTINGKPSILLLVPDALVIKPASATPARAGGTLITGASLVLAVTSAQASEVAFASDNGKLFLSLRPPTATATSPAATTLASIIAATAGAATAGAATARQAGSSGTAGSRSAGGSSPATPTGKTTTTSTGAHP